MDNISETYLRFFEPASMVAKKFDMNTDPCYWMTPIQIAEIIGVPATKGSATQIGRWASSQGLKTRRSNGSRFILMPAPTK